VLRHAQRAFADGLGAVQHCVRADRPKLRFGFPARLRRSGVRTTTTLDVSMASNFGTDLPHLSELLQCWYHQDAWLEFDTDTQIWSAAFDGVSSLERQMLVSELESLILLGAAASHQQIQAHAESLYTDDPMVSLAWVESLHKWLVSQSHV